MAAPTFYPDLPPPGSNNTPQAQSIPPLQGPTTITYPSPPAPYAAHFGLGRHRRLLHNTERNRSNSNSAATFNPQAAEFVPNMPTKRKASSSATPGNKSSAPSAGSGSGPSRMSSDPIIKASDLVTKTSDTPAHTHAHALIGAHSSANHSSEALQNFLREIQDDDEDEVAQYPHTPAPPPHNNASRLILRRSRTLSETTTRPLRVNKLVNPPSEPKTPRLAIMLVELPSSTAQTNRVRYLPLCSAASRGYGSTNADHLMILPSHRDRILSFDRRGTSSVTWPAQELPAELFDWITQYLARDDVKAMRLVNHEFEKKVSRSLFHTSVVPFNTELYDMVGEEARVAEVESKQQQQQVYEGKGKGKATTLPADLAQPPPPKPLAVVKGPLHWKNAARQHDNDRIYTGHGLRVFQGFGPHIRRFGMSFEVSEAQLLQLPVKKELDHVEAYFGEYDWPPPHYTRFSGLEGLEHTADETSRMKDAFGKLEIVQELGLSVESGLGWMSGPDVSVHARVFERGSPVFEMGRGMLDQEMRDAEYVWEGLMASQRSFEPSADGKEISVGFRELDVAADELEGLRGTVFGETERWAGVEGGRVLPDHVVLGGGDVRARLGVLYTSSSQADVPCLLESERVVVPDHLSKEQKEWLLETEWAQRAFVESYMLAIVDNPKVFGSVTSLNIAKFSSGLLPIIARREFWAALPGLRDLTVWVSPDWRTVAKDKAGIPETTHKNPSAAVTLFYGVLRLRLSQLETLKKLNIGWCEGGEHAQGMFARNMSVFPAPITQLEKSLAIDGGNAVLLFKHISELTLHNCWMTPVVLECFVKKHADFKLQKLTLSSVSLTAHPRFTMPVQQPPNIINQIAPNAGGMQQPAAQQPPPWQIPQGQFAVPQNMAAWPAMNAQQLAQMHQQWQQLQMQQQIAGAAQFAQGAPANLPAGFNPFPPAPQIVQVPNTPTTHSQIPADLREGHREGSWPFILNRMFGGALCGDTPPASSAWDDNPVRPQTYLKTLVLESCGYIRIHSSQFDQSVIDTGMHSYTPWFRVRHATLRPLMMENKERHLGVVVQHMPVRELNALQVLWRLREGWEDAVEAEEPEFDGLLRGGTGRVSGTIIAED
ncbi:hypothetical protein LTR15_002659 [Elasticomyces elasticus]|nr:hypothetical protein LTR15_002659 [Elasticomyces elasticus]